MDTTPAESTVVTLRTTDSTAPAPPAGYRQRIRLDIAIGVGLVLAAAGVLDGLVMAFERRVVECEDGHYFPQGTRDFRCFSHPEAGSGIAIVIFSVMLGIVIVLTGLAAGWVLASRGAGRARDGSA